ncbi:Gfo/Idh/MocA family oxidoreductase [Alphaproteobacteria bacterium KMM 3653]|uniref:Gfo/Idh/MocA family oxidoreductase n=1 Tax=Harenicola maris TaxID=2841044 RepID=A0AAP2G5D5_9RHOB|nr:Gfo/Idh/MocA family oxidoreductase [Harenicola maris]
MAERVLRWGILGAANFARNFMGPAIHAAAGNELVALATSSPDKALNFRAFCPALRVCDSHEALLADPDIDAVYIPLPNTMHAPVAERVLRAGKHVLCEKPLGMDLGEIDSLIAARDETGLLAAEAYMIVHHPQWHRTRALVEDGAIGDLVQVTGAFSFDNRDAANIRNKQEMGGGALRDIGVYVIGAARYVTGVEPTDITAQIRWEAGCDVVSRVQGRLGDVGYSAYVSTRMHPHQEMVFHGTEGLIRLTAPFNPRSFGEGRIELHQPGLGLRVERFPLADQYKLQVENFAAAVRGADYPWTLENARGTQAVLEEIFRVATDFPA